MVVVDRFLDIIIICEAAVLPLALCLGLDLLLMLAIVTLSQLRVVQTARAQKLGSGFRAWLNIVARQQVNYHVH